MNADSSLSFSAFWIQESTFYTVHLIGMPAYFEFNFIN